MGTRHLFAGWAKTSAGSHTHSTGLGSRLAVGPTGPWQLEKPAVSLLVFA
jgi:hypothetical protein